MAKKSRGLSRKAVQNFKSGDFLLIMLVIALVVFGVIMVFSSSYYYALDKKRGCLLLSQA